MKEKNRKPRRPRGRPKADPAEVKRSAIALSTTLALYHQLRRGAERNGRSLTKEVETRLQEAYDTEAAYGGPRVAAVLRRLAAAASTIDNRYGRSPFVDPVIFEELRRIWHSIIDEEAPPAAPGVELLDIWVDLRRSGEGPLPIRVALTAYPRDKPEADKPMVMADDFLLDRAITQLAFLLDRAGVLEAAHNTQDDPSPKTTDPK